MTVCAAEAADLDTATSMTQGAMQRSEWRGLGYRQVCDLVLVIAAIAALRLRGLRTGLTVRLLRGTKRRKRRTTVLDCSRPKACNAGLLGKDRKIHFEINGCPLCG
eukprot:3875845-Amphidinium_carterae.1